MKKMEVVQKEPKDKRYQLTLCSKAVDIVDKRITFCRQIIRESSYARKETVDINILLTSRNADRKIT